MNTMNIAAPLKVYPINVSSDYLDEKCRIWLRSACIVFRRGLWLVGSREKYNIPELRLGPTRGTKWSKASHVCSARTPPAKLEGPLIGLFLLASRSIITTPYW